MTKNDKHKSCVLLFTTQSGLLKTLKKELFLLKILSEKERKLETCIFSFPTIFYTHPKKNFCCEVAFILSSANAFNLDQSENLSFGKELKWRTALY